MRTVDIGDLETQLSAYLQYVKDGEEIIIRDRQTPVARLSPISIANRFRSEHELVADGTLKLPEQPMNWEAFWALPSGNVSRDAALEAVLEDRAEDR